MSAEQKRERKEKVVGYLHLGLAPARHYPQLAVVVRELVVEAGRRYLTRRRWSGFG